MDQLTSDGSELLVMAERSLKCHHSDDEDEDDEGSVVDLEPTWVVKRILDEREGKDKVIRYLILWDGYEDHESSWEPVENFTDAATQLAEWEVQKAAGDRLEGEQLQDLENRIWAFQKAQEAISKASSPAAEADSDSRSVRSGSSSRSKTSTSRADQPRKKKVKRSVLSKHIARPPEKPQPRRLARSPPRKINRASAISSKSAEQSPASPQHPLESPHMLGDTINGQRRSPPTSLAKTHVTSILQSEKPDARQRPSTSLQAPILSEEQMRPPKHPFSVTTKTPAQPSKQPSTLPQKAPPATKSVQQPKHIWTDPFKQTPSHPKPGNKLSTSGVSKQPTDTAVNRKLSVGTKFRNLQHMNRAQKKSAQERPPDPNDPNLKFAVGGNATRAQTPPLPQSRADQRSPSLESAMFFSEADPQSIAGSIPGSPLVGPANEIPIANTTETPLSPIQKSSSPPNVEAPVFTRTLLLRRKSTGVVHPAVEEARQEEVIESSPQTGTATTRSGPLELITGISTGVEICHQPPEESQQEDDSRPTLTAFSTNLTTQPQVLRLETVSMQTFNNDSVADSSTPTRPARYDTFGTKTGLRCGPDELIVHLSLGDYEIGPVRVSGLKPWVRTLLIHYKRANDAHELRIHFSQDMVLNVGEYYNRSGAFYNPLPPAVVFPYEHTAQVCHELSQGYLEFENLKALWELPSESLVFVLFSPRSPSARSQPRYANMSASVDLVLEVCQFHPTARSYEKRAACRSWPNGECSRGHQCAFRHDPMLAAESGGERPKPPTRARTFDESAFKSAKATERRSSVSAVSDRDMSEGKSGHMAHNVEASSVMKTEQNEEKVTSPPATAVSVDWTPDLDYAMIFPKVNPKDGAIHSSWVFVGLPESFTVQARSFEQWASQKTTKAQVLGRGDWDTFQKFYSLPGPKLILFHKDTPSYATLPGFSKFLHSHSADCYQVSWAEPKMGAKVNYHLTTLFPKGHVMLLSEEAMVSNPAAACFTMSWFLTNYGQRRMDSKLLLRPNIVEWLQYRYKHLKDVENNPGDANLMGQMLGHVHELAVMDVTLPGVEQECDPPQLVSLPQLLDYDHSVTASMDGTSIQQRDQILIEYFIGFAIAEADKHRKFLVVHGGNSVQPADGQHVAFRSVETFAKEMKDGAKHAKK